MSFKGECWVLVEAGPSFLLVEGNIFLGNGPFENAYVSNAGGHSSASHIGSAKCSSWVPARPALRVIGLVRNNLDLR